VASLFGTKCRVAFHDAAVEHSGAFSEKKNFKQKTLKYRNVVETHSLSKYHLYKSKKCYFLCGLIHDG